MTINSRAARSVRKMREQMRDLAAAEHGAAAATTAAAAATVVSEHARLHQTTTDAMVALQRVTNVHSLDQIGGVIAEQQATVVDAEAQHATATGITDLAAVRLRARIRQLRTAERVVEQLDDARNVREAKAEQRGHDDLNARRR